MNISQHFKISGLPGALLPITDTEDKRLESNTSLIIHRIGLQPSAPIFIYVSIHAKHTHQAFTFFFLTRQYAVLKTLKGIMHSSPLRDKAGEVIMIIRWCKVNDGNVHC